ncbi:putative general secretion pathway protein M [Nitrobacter hamburgensis X14]|uniref:Putative general secretion pathway protein M n=1 Tax=Nitrobacter hamburgensis (strain DSM 10229 / NCIMB 13809 / X14) TaxID=323097 RepID=Q1QQ81_NITHX|nr:type II secretion system protein GspM [Nitrobacter hamburgensis]ABE61616.1 putative general secretion pathway protein M [Nitrobacter hamburgensis X14]
MNLSSTLRKLTTAPLPAAMIYFGLLVLLLFTIASSISDLFGKRADVAAVQAMLDQFEGRRPVAAKAGFAGAAPSGSPFLEGATVTVAGAALLQRVSAAVTKFGGNVLSSQVDLHGSQSKVGFLTIIASCDIEQTGLQQLLYDIEAGMPFLFVDQLVVQTPTGFAASGEGKLRILLTVSGQWRGAA